MNVIKIDNDFSYLLTKDTELLEKLWSKMRWRKRNYFHSPRYKQRKWDGYIDFFNKKNGRFLTGLIPEVTAALQYWNVDYTKVDQRIHTKFLYDSIDSQFLNQWLPPGMEPITLEDYQVDLVNQAIKHHRGIVKGPPGVGKAQPLDSLVYTPDGPIKMGEIKVGDEICGLNGVTKVIGVYPQGKKPCVKITFSNGDKVECCKEHLWLIDCPQNGWENKVLNTEFLINNLKTKSGRPRYAIKSPKIVTFKENQILIDAYLMGLLIGDGHFGKQTINISNTETHIIEKVISLLDDKYELSHRKKGDYSICKRKKTKAKNKYLEAIRHYKLDGVTACYKWIPKEFKYNTVENRIKLVQGMMDSDGYIDESGSLEYTTCSKVLALDFKEVIESLGGIGRIRSKIPTYSYKSKKKKGKRSYTVTFMFPNPKDCVTLDFKKDRAKTGSYKKRKRFIRIINKIEEIGEKDCQCIAVESDDHMYLTDHMIPTHNTFVMLCIMKALPPGTPILFLANRKGIIRQNYKEMIKWGFKNVGQFYGDAHEPNVITCATVQSLHHLDKHLHKFKAVIVDEIHMMASDKALKAYKKLTGCDVRIAVSGTPFKFTRKKKDGTEAEGDKVQKYSVKGFFGPVFKTRLGEITTSMMQERGRLSKSKGTFFIIRQPQIPYDIYLDAVTNGIAQSVYLHKVVKKLASTLTGRTLILVERLAHGDTLSQMIPGSLWIQGKDDDETRDYVIDRLQNADNAVAIATSGIFSAAINVFVHQIINVSGGKASHDIIQRMGRGLRPAGDKSILNYYDFLFRINPYLDKHSNERVVILKGEGHEIEIKEVDFL